MPAARRRRRRARRRACRRSPTHRPRARLRRRRPRRRARDRHRRPSQGRSARAGESGARSAARRSARSPGRSPPGRSRCTVSPQATSQKGSAALSRPSTSAGLQASRRRATAVAVPMVAARYPNRTSPASKARAAISAPGESPPSTPTLMKRYEAPQRDASVRISGQYLRVTCRGYPHARARARSRAPSP